MVIMVNIIRVVLLRIGLGIVCSILFIMGKNLIIMNSVVIKKLILWLVMLVNWIILLFWLNVVFGKVLNMLVSNELMLLFKILFFIFVR